MMKKVLESTNEEEILSMTSSLSSQAPFNSLKLSPTKTRIISEESLEKLHKLIHLMTIFPVQYFSSLHQKQFIFSLCILESLIFLDFSGEKSNETTWNLLLASRRILFSFCRSGFSFNLNLVSWFIFSQICYSLDNNHQNLNLMKKKTLEIQLESLR